MFALCLKTSWTAAATVLLASDEGGLSVVLLTVAEASYCPTEVGDCPVEEERERKERKRGRGGNVGG